VHDAPKSWNELPTSSGTILREEYTLEFKREADPSNRAELAKDVGLLANMYGGVILVGANETPSGVDYIGLSAALARTLQEAYTLAVRDFCCPHPRFALSEILHPRQSETVVLAVSVEPFPDQPVGVSFPDSMGRPTNAWRFPIRVLNHSTFARPDQLMLWLNPKTRRTAIILAEIRDNAQIAYSCDAGAKSNLQPFQGEARLSRWSMSENFVEVAPSGNPIVAPFRAPLEDVVSVWKALHGVWQIQLRGTVVPGTKTGEFRYQPGC
jgi:hypothetical protein